MTDVAAITHPTLPGAGQLIRLKLTLLRNRARQLIDQSPMRLLLVLLFIAVIWVSLYFVFELAFRFLRRFEQESVIAIPYVFHVFFLAMTALLAFSTAVLVYGAMFHRPEPFFLLATPHSTRNIVAVMYIEALFFASWSLVLLGAPLMLAIGQVLKLPWHFYLTFLVAFLGFVPIPGAIGLIVAVAIARWMPRLARRTLYYGAAAVILLTVVWWTRVWAVTSRVGTDWWDRLIAEMQYVRGALLPSAWVTHAIQHAIQNHPMDSLFYVAVTISTAVFLSWVAVNVAGRQLLPAFARAHSMPDRSRASSSAISSVLTRIAFFYIPRRMRTLVLKDVRNFLRDPVQWSQLIILLGLLGLYLAYLPRSRPEGFTIQWRALICFLNFGAVTLILSTFTSRFVFPMISLEGQTMWLVGLWPLSRRSVVWAKFFYALTITAAAAMTVTFLSIRALNLPLALAAVQALGTLACCFGLCGLSVGLGARLPNYREPNAGRIASGLGGTVNLIASVLLVAACVAVVGAICGRMAQVEHIDRLGRFGAAMFMLLIAVGIGTGLAAMAVGVRAFERQQF